MKLLITDDCNLAWDEKLDYFLYGGIAVCEEEARLLAEQLLNLKEGAKIKKDKPIKWTNNNRKGEKPLEDSVHALLKKQILDLVASSNCKIIICLSPQGFYHDYRLKGGKVKMGINTETQKRTQEYGLNDVLGKFDQYLGEINNVGMVLADQFGDNVRLHMEKHCFDIFPDGPHNRLKRIILPVIQLDNKVSYLHQINDVVLGAIYFSLREMGHNFLPLIRDNFWSQKEKDYPSIIGKGFNVYPEMSKTAGLAEGKRKLKDKFLRLVKGV